MAGQMTHASRQPITNPHLRRMWALAYVIPKRANPKPAADVWFAEARALLSDATPPQPNR